MASKKRIYFGILVAIALLGVSGYLITLQTVEKNPSANAQSADPTSSGAINSDALAYLDSSGLCYLKDSTGQLLVKESTITAYGEARGIGSAGTQSTTDCLEEGVRFLGLIGGGLMQLLSGTYVVSSTVSINYSGIAIEGTANRGGAGNPDGGSVIEASLSTVSPVVLISTTSTSSVASVSLENLVVAAPSSGSSRSEVGVQIGTASGDAAGKGASGLLFNAVKIESFGFDFVTYDTAGFQNNFNALTLLAPLAGGAVFDGANQFYFNGLEISNWNGSNAGDAGTSADMIFGDALGTGHVSVDQQLVFNGGHIAYNNVAMQWISDIGARALTFTGTEFESIVHYFDIEHDQSSAIRATITNGVFYSNTATENFITSLGGSISPSNFDAAVTLEEGNVFGSYASGFAYNSLSNLQAVLLVYPSVHFDGSTPTAPLAANSGVAVFSGDGHTKSFSVPHRLLNVQLQFSAAPQSASCASLGMYVSYDSAYVTFNFTTAPPRGTNNCAISWSGQYVPNANY
jgi:hypothetical protein